MIDLKLIVGTNWSPRLIEEIKSPYVKEMYGSLNMSPVGTGRPSFILAKPTEKEFGEYIQRIHSKGMEFNYLLNGACMGNMEYDKKTHQELIRHISWANDMGVDSVTVTIPYLIEIIKNQFPDIKVKASVIATINSVNRAKYFEDLGVDSMMLDFNINRDFNLLKKIRKSVKCELTLLLDDPCLYQCPYRYYHYNLLAHSTHVFNPLGGFYVDYCIIKCTSQRLNNPAEIIKARWIRPEDLHEYEKIGMDSFKISGRRMSTKWILNAVNAYSSRRYDGNLTDILDAVTPGVEEDVESPQYRTLIEGSEEFLNREKLLRLHQLHPCKPYVDNRALDGFLEFFKTKNCISECGECNYCKKIAEKTIKIDETQKNYIEAISGLLKDMTSSRLFSDEETIGKEISKGKVEWNDKAKMLYEGGLQKTPEAFKEIARKFVAQRAETNARERRNFIIEEDDVIKAFLSETPAVFKEQMIKDLTGLGINIEKYSQ